METASSDGYHHMGGMIMAGSPATTPVLICEGCTFW